MKEGPSKEQDAYCQETLHNIVLQKESILEDEEVSKALDQFGMCADKEMGLLCVELGKPSLDSAAVDLIDSMMPYLNEKHQSGVSDILNKYGENN